MKHRCLILSVFFVMSQGSIAHAGAVATASDLATRTAADVLHRGGNATDAIIAASFVLNVTQPFNMGMGGGGFFLITDQREVSFFDSRETAPASAHERMFLLPTGSPIPEFPDRETGPIPVGIPGMVKGLFEVHKRYGSMPWATLLEPAIRLAREGYTINSLFETALNEAWGRISGFVSTASVYASRRTPHLVTGEVLRVPPLASSIERIAQLGGDEFYTGELAKSWVKDAQSLGVKMTLDDLEKYQVASPNPIQFDFMGLHFYTAALPSAAGILVAGTMRFLEHYYQSHALADALSSKRVIVTTEAMKYFQDLRDQTIADFGYATIDPQQFLGSPQESQAWQEITRRIDQRFREQRVSEQQFSDSQMEAQAGSVPKLALQPHHHTTHLSVVDDHGMAVSYTTTIEEWFGSGLTVANDGFLLNNELSDFDAEPGHPNSPAAGKRPRSNMSPLLIFENDKPSAALVGVVGAAGGQYIPTSIIVFLENVYFYGMSARAASAAPRIHPDEDKLQVEKFPSSTLSELRAAGYAIDVANSWWSALQVIARKSGQDTWNAVAEPREESSAVSW